MDLVEVRTASSKQQTAVVGVGGRSLPELSPRKHICVRRATGKERNPMLRAATPAIILRLWWLPHESSGREKTDGTSAQKLCMREKTRPMTPPTALIRQSMRQQLGRGSRLVSSGVRSGYKYLCILVPIMKQPKIGWIRSFICCNTCFSSLLS